MTRFTLHDLETIVAARATADPSESWTAKLVAEGSEKVAKKLGEEAVETVIAVLGTDTEALVSESADLLYHWLVACHVHGVSLDQVVAELERRTAQSGLAEKASRTA